MLESVFVFSDLELILTIQSKALDHLGSDRRVLLVDVRHALLIHSFLLYNP